MAAVFGGIHFFGKLGQPLSRCTLWVKNFIEIALSSTVFEIQAFLCFVFLKKDSKIQNGSHFWGVKYVLKLGKAILHRYPVGQNFCRNPTSKFLFYEENGFKKYSYITSIVLYVYLMMLYFQFCVLHFLSKIQKYEDDPYFWGGENFWKIKELKNSTKSLCLTWLRRYK